MTRGQPWPHTPGAANSEKKTGPRQSDGEDAITTDRGVSSLRYAPPAVPPESGRRRTPENHAPENAAPCQRGRTGPVAWSDNGQLERHVWWGRLAGRRAANFERRLARGGWWPAVAWGAQPMAG